MKLLYISTPAYLDCDFPLIRTFQKKGLDVTVLILVPCFMLRSTLVDIKKQIPKTGIFLASEYEEFRQYEKYMDMSKVYVSNRIKRKSYSWSYIKETFLLYRFFKRGNFDIIHYDSFFSGKRRFFYKVSNWVTTFHDPFPHSGEEWKNYQVIYKNVIKDTTGYVLLNEKQKQQFCDFYHVDPKNILINHLGIYDNIRSFVKTDSKVVRNNILFFGRISPYKGVEYLCEAMKLVRQQIPDATLTIAGGGKLYFDIEPYRQLGYIDIRNHYVDMSELADLLSRCEISVCPYTDATQSGVIMTSFALCKPVVATNVGGLGEMVNDSKSGIIVEPRDVNSLSISIISLLKDREKLNYMKKYIQSQYSSGEMSWDSIADKYINYYKSILK